MNQKISRDIHHFKIGNEMYIIGFLYKIICAWLNSVK